MEKPFFIDEKYINKTLEFAKEHADERVDEVLKKAESLVGLTPEEVAILLFATSEEQIEKIFKVADKIKEHVYGERVVMFAPLYISNYCVNGCTYCGFGCDNKLKRKKLTMDEVRSEVKILEKMGHKRLALEAGEDPVNCDIDYVLECIKTIYDMKFENGEIRRVNVNIASTTVENYKKLKEVGIGTYILFQETYHKKTYEKVHPTGPKSNYEYHTTAFDRAMQAGVDDVGAGVLFGFYDYRYEILALMLHNEHLEKDYGVGFHTISVPRICAVEGLENVEYENAVDDATFKRIVAIIRLAVPFTGIIISTRETQEMRKQLIRLGVSQLSGGSNAEVGGYTSGDQTFAQFSVNDERSARDIIYWLMEEGLVPSFCTACYRKGRTGDRFMQLAKSGNIKNVCLPNGLMTLLEYSMDYGDEEFSKLANQLIEEKIPTIENEKIRQLVIQNLVDIKNGKRDLYI